MSSYRRTPSNALPRPQNSSRYRLAPGLGRTMQSLRSDPITGSSTLSGRRRRARLLSRWPPSAAQTGRAVFPHPAFTKTFSLERQRRRTSRQGRRNRTCSTAAHPLAGGTSEPSLPPVASSHSTSILDRGCPGLSLKELSTSTTLLISSPVPLRPSSPTAFPGTLCRHSLVARLSPHLWYYSVVRRLLEHRFPLRFRL